MYNLDDFNECVVTGDSIHLISGDKLKVFTYVSEQQAKESLGYLLEAMRRGDALVNL